LNYISLQSLVVQFHHLFHLNADVYNIFSKCVMKETNFPILVFFVALVKHTFSIFRIEVTCTLKTETVCSFETLGTIYQTTWCYNPKY
jgi:hypothetical protein